MGFNSAFKGLSNKHSAETKQNNSDNNNNNNNNNNRFTGLETHASGK